MDFPKILIQWRASVGPVPLAKWPQAWHWWQLAGFGSQHSHSQVPPGLAQTPPNYRSLCSSYQRTPGWTQAVAYLGLHQSPSQEAQTSMPVLRFRPYNSTTQLVPQMTDPKGGRGRHRVPLSQFHSVGLPLHKSLSVVMTSAHGQSA